MRSRCTTARSVKSERSSSRAHTPRGGWQTLFGDQGVIGSLGPGAIHLSMSTISVALSERLARANAKAGQRFVAAPVFGRPDVAAAGKLFIVAAGAPDAVTACSPLLEALGQKTFSVGAAAPTANPGKVSGQFLLAPVIQ